MRRIDKEKARLLRERRLQSGASVQPNELSEKARLLRNHANYTGDQTDAIVQPNEPLGRARHLRERRLQSGASVRRDEPFDGTSSIYSSLSQAKFLEELENVMDAADKKFVNKKDKVASSLRDMGARLDKGSSA